MSINVKLLSLLILMSLHVRNKRGGDIELPAYIFNKHYFIIKFLNKLFKYLKQFLVIEIIHFLFKYDYIISNV